MHASDICSSLIFNRLCNKKPLNLGKTHDYYSVKVSTIAGQNYSNTNIDGNGTNATFLSPFGITNDKKGNKYIVQSDGIVRRIDSANNITTITGQSGKFSFADGYGTNALFSGPRGIAIDSFNNLYVTDVNNRIIRRIDSSGNVTTIAGQVGVSGSTDGIGTNALFSFPFGITIDENNNLYITDIGNNNIRKISSQMIVTTIAGQVGASGYADGVGTQATFNVPRGICCDVLGNIYIADTYNYIIRKITPLGIVSTIAGQPGVSGFKDGIGTNSLFGGNNGLRGITCDSLGRIFVSDGQNNMIRLIETNGTVSSIAGNYQFSGNSDGLGPDSLFNTPIGITIDQSGALYIVDSKNKTIRKAEPLGGGTNKQIITFSALALKAFGTAPFSLSARSSAGTNYPITYSSSDPTIATVLGNKVTILGVGSCMITASQPGDSTFKAANDVSRTLTVTQGSQSIKLSLTASRPYSTNTFTLPLNSSAELPVSYSSSDPNVASILSNLVTITGVGSTTITASQNGDHNYAAASNVYQTLTVTQAKQTISFNTPSTKTYGDISFNLVATSSSGLPVTFASSNTNVATISGNLVTIVGAGKSSITASQTGNANYHAAANVSKTLTVAKAAQTVSFTPTTPVNFIKNGTFTLSANSTSGSLITFKSGIPSIITISGNTATIKAKGTVSVIATAAATANYNAASGTNSITIQ